MSLRQEIFRKYIISDDVNIDVFLNDLKSLGYEANETQITALAYQRKDALAKLESLHLQITDHILKILVMPNSRDVTHWKSELNTWRRTLIKYNKSKTKSKTNYTDKLLNLWLWEYPLGTQDDIKASLEGLQERGYSVPEELTEMQIEELKKEVKRFIEGIK